VSDATGEESEALIDSGAIVVPDTFVWSPGPVTVTVLVTVQLKAAWAE
jgi:hypothetical protein